MCQRRRGESLEDLEQRIKELTRKAFSADRREEEGLVALQNAVSEEQAKQIFLGQYKTMGEAVRQLSKVENFLQHRTHKGGVRTIQEAPTSTVQPTASAKASGGTAGGAPKVNTISAQSSPTSSDLSRLQDRMDKGLDELRQMFRQHMNSQSSKQGSPRRSRSKARSNGYRRAQSEARTATTRDTKQREPLGGPSQERPCLYCKSPDHWLADCTAKGVGGFRRKIKPRRLNMQGNGDGLSLGPKAQPN